MVNGVQNEDFQLSPHGESIVIKRVWTRKAKIKRPTKTLERWLPAPGFENYSVSNFGRVMNSKGHLLQLFINHCGYVIAYLSKNNKPKCHMVGRLVAQAFIPNPENKPTVNHKDGVKENNYHLNLEWATHSEQILHAYAKGLRRRTTKTETKEVTHV